jgi:hypothetical protein
MTVGLPGAGIGGLFYLISTVLLPVRSLARRLRGDDDGVPWRHHAHNLTMAIGIITAIWLAGWLLALVVPHGILAAPVPGHGAAAPARTVLSMATFTVALGTLAFILIAVEVARVVHVRRTLAEGLAAEGEMR